MVRRTTGIRAALLCGAAIAGALALATAAEAAQPGPRNYEIPAQDLSAALRRYALRANRQIIFSEAVGAGLRSRPVSGVYTAEQALQLLLQGTGFTASVLPGDVLRVYRGSPPTPPVATVVSGNDVVRPRPPVLAALSSPPPERGAFSQLEEVIVTATRQFDTVNRVPLSITALTQRTLDQQGARTIADLQGAAPALAITQQMTPGTANIAIRGISDLGQGAATTGFYLDDTALQKRNATGAFNGNGTPLPPLFDLERVEVLRGPQGTLFGGSSEGGTVRYITPQPSLARFSSYARAEISQQKYAGDPSYEAGVAVGGPIIQDKLGFRASFFDRKTAGYTDIVDRVTGNVRFKDTNQGETKVFRAALAWQVNERLRATLAYFASNDAWDDTTSNYSRSTTSPIVAQPICFNTSAITPATRVNNPPAVACGAAGVTYRRPGSTIGPYNLEPDQTLASQFKLPTSTTLNVPTLTLDYDLGEMTVKSVTSYVRDVTRQRVHDHWSQIRDQTAQINYGDQTVRRGFRAVPLLPDILFTNGVVDGRNGRVGLSQEVRLASTGDGRPFSWVAGVYYSNIRNTQKFDLQYPGLEAISQALYGLSVEQRYGTSLYPINGVAVDAEAKRQNLKDVEIASFGELNYWVTDRLKLTAGVRASRVTFDFREAHWGPLHGFSVPTAANGGTVSGAIKEDPVTPKFGAQYELTNNDMIYATASKGYRAGGVNGGIPQAVCAAGFGNFGLTVDAMPLTYSSDSVWNYEVGGKVRIFDDRVQLNGAAYRIDWKSPQLAITLGQGCPAFLSNAGSARSEGFEFEAAARLWSRLTVNIGVGYVDARYTEDALGLPGSSPPANAAFKGQKIPVSPLTLQIGGRYDMALTSRVSAYVRADYRYIQRQKNIAQTVFSFGGFTNNAFAPDNVYPNTSRVNARIGIEYGDLDINIFANNLFNSDKGVFIGGRGTCAAPSTGGTAACASFAIYDFFGPVQRAVPPRQVGLQIAYRR